MIEEKRRIDLIDLWRSSAIVCMVAYHYFYNQAFYGRIAWSELFSPPYSLLQIYSSYSFILIAGISSRLSRSNIRRGAIVFACAMAITFVTWMIEYNPRSAYEPQMLIAFGILHFLGICMMLYGLIGKYLQRVPAEPWVYLLMFFATRYWTQNAPLVESKLLFPFGFRFFGFVSSDYYPMLPWIFLFLLGTWIGGIIKDRRDDWQWIYKPVPRLLTWPGRHSMVIYLLHQPIMVAWEMMWIFYLYAKHGFD